MKKAILSTALFFLMYSKSEACAWYDPDYEYFNLFTQSIIKDKSYLPFLHTLSNRFYGHEHYEIPDENIESWQKYFGNTLNYKETKFLVEKAPMEELNSFKKGSSGNSLLQKLGSYEKYKEGIDYLIEAKYLEPFMRINYIESPDSWYYSGDENAKNATQLDYDKTVAALTSLYNAAKNPEIKLRYGYQLVRFNHYTRNYASSTDAFREFVEPLKIKSAPYFMALDQLAGAQRGLKINSEANYNFFQVFMNSKSRKESAFVSMRLSDSASFDNLLKKAQTPQEKNMAYFLLGYQDFNNPVPMMEKMYDIDPNSEILKVLAARSINDLERSYLPIYFAADNKDNSNSTVTKDQSPQTEKNTVSTELSFWQKIKNFFSNLFSSDKKEAPTKASDQNDSDLLKNPNRIPFYTENTNLWTDERSENYLDGFEKITAKIKEKSNDEFWQIADAYLSFLKKDYKKSTETLNQIKTTNPEYITEINRMKMLNDIVSQPKITAEYEEHLMNTYPELFGAMTSMDFTPDYYGDDRNATQDFIRDILANRYFIQGEEGKSFLMNNKLSDLQYNPNSKLVKSVEDFYKKPNKSSLEQKIIAKNIDDVGNIQAFFNVIYGDREMRLANFEKAKSLYDKAKGFSGIPRFDYDWQEGEKPIVKKINYGDAYNGFQNISSLIFGHNNWESFNSPETQSMKPENFEGFDFIKNTMNKSELAGALIELKKIGMGSGTKASQANQLIGNLLYNTSILGYYRHVFVMDIDNENSPKFHFYNTDEPTFKYYYKNFTWNSFIEPDNFDLSIDYYQKALKQSHDEEQKARILFQMASAEQGKFYQYAEKQSLDLKYDDPDYSKKQEEHAQKINAMQYQKYKTYFAELKKNYGHTQTSKSLQGSCSYYDYFMKRN